jgi:hypothetical protein
MQSSFNGGHNLKNKSIPLRPDENEIGSIKTTEQDLGSNDGDLFGDVDTVHEDLIYAAWRLRDIGQKKQAAAVVNIYLDQIPTLKSSAVSEPDCSAASPNQTVRKPLPWTGDEPPFVLGTKSEFFGLNQIHPKNLVHTLAIGGTGSGKTISCVIPLLKAQLSYALPTHDGLMKSSILVIDPKFELLEIVQSVLDDQGESDRLIVVGRGKGTPAIRFFGKNENLSNREILSRLDVVLGTAELSDSSHQYWHVAGLQVVERFMNLEVAYRTSRNCSLIARLRNAGPGTDSIGEISQLSSYWKALSTVLDNSRAGRFKFRSMNASLKSLLNEAGLGDHPDAAMMDTFIDEAELMQWAYRLQAADPVLKLCADPEIERVVDFRPFPGDADSILDHSLDLMQAMDAGKVVVFQPTGEMNSLLAARALKSRWYAAVRARDDMQRPVGVVVDEFQKFVTLDAVSGDANFMDVARAYRCNVVLATQSIEALHNALKSSRHAESAVAAIVANTPSKFFFATKDNRTDVILKNLIPKPSGAGPHIIDARPPAVMRAGEAYWSLANGQWGRGRAQLQLPELISI